MNYIDIIIKSIIDNFDFSYMFTINVFTYFIIKIIDYFNGDKKVSVFIKRSCLVICSIIAFIIYKEFCNIDIKILINSTVLAPVFWSWILRPICIKLKIGYKKDIDSYI